MTSDLIPPDSNDLSIPDVDVESEQQPSWKQKRTALLNELAQARKLIIERTEDSGLVEVSPAHLERIGQLEQALADSMATLEKLQFQISERHFLETQLAITEEVATLQQQALAKLRHQLQEQQELLATKISESELKDQTVKELLETVENLAQSQQTELERFKVKWKENRSAIQSTQAQLSQQISDRQEALEAQKETVWKLEAQVLTARTLTIRLEGQLKEAQEQIEELYRQFGDRSASLNKIETTLRQTQSLVSAKNQEMASLYQQISQLQNELNQAEVRQIELEQLCQELTREKQQYQATISELQQEKIHVQDNMLNLEYESHLEYWKQQYQMSHQQTEELIEMIYRLIPNLPPELEELLKSRAPQIDSTDFTISHIPPVMTESASSGIHKPRPVELPKFLKKT